jgi:CHASE3 domain sensor protein
MPRATLVLIVLLLLLIGGAVLLSMNAHEVPTKTIEAEVQS